MGGVRVKLAEEIGNALRLKELFGATCLSDPESSRLLRELRELIHRTGSVMLQSGVAAACTRCAAAVGKGSCCFREMGESYGPTELFVNLLLGADLAGKTDCPESCHFAGERGCTLPARQCFCLNYFCPELKQSLGEKTILNIQRQVAAQLLVAWELERALTRCVADAGRRWQT